jgi:putative transposase
VSAFVDERRADFGVELICQTLGVSASAYYQRKTGQRSARAIEDERLLEVIKQTHVANYEAYGSRRMWKALRRHGESAPRCQVERLMAANGICGAKRRGRPWRTTIQGAETATAPDLLDRDFSAERPDEKWCADLTYIRCWEGVVFFSFVIDCYSRMVVGWQFAGHMRTKLVGDALEMAVGQRRPDPDALLIHHSDRGSQYTSAQFNDALDDHGVLASLGSTGDAYDNAMAESFVDSFKTEPIADRPWRTRSELELAIVEWVGWFNHQRLHSSLEDLPPAEFEALYDLRYVLNQPLSIS